MEGADAHVIDLVGETRCGVLVYPLEAAREVGVEAVVTGRDGGVSDGPFDSLNLGGHVGDDVEHVSENRRRVATAMAVETHELLIVRQVHGTTVLDAGEVGPESEGDGLVGGTDERALAMLVADCVPILLIDVTSTRFAVVHAGWRGLAAGVLTNALARFEDPRGLRAILGPSISGRAYQVGPEVTRHFAGYGASVTPQEHDRSLLDLRGVAIQQLRGARVPPTELFVSRQVTDGGATFFSDRARRPCGRFALVAKRAS